MSTAELKIKLISEISQSDNEELLKEVYRLLETGNDKPAQYEFTEEQISLVNETLEEVKNGKFLTEEEEKKKTDKWLEE